MKQMLNSVIAAAFVLACAGAALAKPVTVTGTLMDEGCSMMMAMNHGSADHSADHADAGADHSGHQMPMPMMADMAQCALMCARNGEPVALVTGDGKVYRITGGLAANKNEKLLAHLGHSVEITGEVTEKDGKMELAANALTMAKK